MQPFQWGSKRTGPDLARIGGKYPNMWHYKHFWEPREVTQGSIMPRYTWLFNDKINFTTLPAKLRVMQKLGVPYTNEEIEKSIESAKAQAKTIADDLGTSGVPAKVAEMDVVALIAYMQRVGVDYGSLPEKTE
jgi:cytochrome c oxidase cbb3-type subunit I/II